MADDERAKLAAMLAQHKDKDFVQRILSPDNYPVMKLDRTKDGMDYGTHLMTADTDSAGVTRTYPMIIRDQEAGNLVRLTPAAAREHANRTGEFIPVKDAAEANWFGENYKKLWSPESVQKMQEKAGMVSPARSPLK